MNSADSINSADSMNGYDRQELLGKGQFGKTYKVVKDDKIYALKKININRPGSSEKNRERIQLECEALKRLGEHPRIPKFYEHFEIGDFEYIVQEFIDGEPLQEQLDNKRLFNQEELIYFLFSLLTTLDYVHSYKFSRNSGDNKAEAQPYKLIHRDIKPNNIIKQNQDYYLIDFGVAKIRSYITGEQSEPGTIAGTPRYISPEVAAGKSPTTASDIYSLGITAIQLTTGFLPNRFDDQELKLDLEKGCFVWPKKYEKRIHVKLRKLLLKMTLRDPRERMNDASQAIKELELVQQDIIKDSKRNELLRKIFNAVVGVRRQIFVLLATLFTITFLLYNSNPVKQCKTNNNESDASLIAKEVVSDIKKNDKYPELKDDVQSKFVVENLGCLVIITGTEKYPKIDSETQEQIEASISEEVRRKMSNRKIVFKDYSLE